VLNAANEEAVGAFLAQEIPFSGIVHTVEQALAAFPGGGDTLQDILEADRWAREYVRDKSGSLKTK
jgi:1-deoxy-D-xylulose-5-phosphate reductoisomerase